MRSSVFAFVALAAAVPAVAQTGIAAHVDANGSCMAWHIETWGDSLGAVSYDCGESGVIDGRGRVHGSCDVTFSEPSAYSLWYGTDGGIRIDVSANGDITYPDTTRSPTPLIDMLQPANGSLTFNTVEVGLPQNAASIEFQVEEDALACPEHADDRSRLRDRFFMKGRRIVSYYRPPAWFGTDLLQEWFLLNGEGALLSVRAGDGTNPSTGLAARYSYAPDAFVLDYGNKPAVERNRSFWNRK